MPPYLILIGSPAVQMRPDEQQAFVRSLRRQAHSDSWLAGLGWDDELPEVRCVKGSDAAYDHRTIARSRSPPKMCHANPLAQPADA